MSKRKAVAGSSKDAVSGEWRAAVARAPRAVLEELVLKALANEAVSLADLGPPPKQLARVAPTCSFDAHSATGAFDALGGVTMEQIMTRLPTVERLQSLSLVCRAWLALRREPRMWEAVDLTRFRPTRAGLLKIPRVIDLRATRELKLEAFDKQSLVANDLKAFVAEAAMPHLTALDVSGKRFTDSVVVALAKKFTAVERLAIRNNGGLKEDTIVAFARAAPRLVALDVDVRLGSLLDRLASLATATRGAGACSLLLRVAYSGAWYNAGYFSSTQLLELPQRFPELEELELTGLCVGRPAQQLRSPTFARLREIKLDSVVPFGAGYNATPSEEGLAAQGASAEALLRRVIDNAPTLEEFLFAARENYVSQREYKEGKRMPPPPNLGAALAAAHAPFLVAFTLGGFATSPLTFDAFDAPLLEVARISVAKEDSRWRTREYNDAISECETALAALRALFPNADISANGVSRYAPLPSLVQSRIRTARARIHASSA